MTEDRDPALQALFAEAREELEGQEQQKFTSRVMAATRRFKLRLLGGSAAAASLVIAMALLFSVPLFDFAFLVTQILATELVALPAGTLAWALAPINNVGAAVVVIGKLIRMGMKKARSAAYVN